MDLINPIKPTMLHEHIENLKNELSPETTKMNAPQELKKLDRLTRIMEMIQQNDNYMKGDVESYHYHTGNNGVGHMRAHYANQIKVRKYIRERLEKYYAKKCFELSSNAYNKTKVYNGII